MTAAVDFPLLERVKCTRLFSKKMQFSVHIHNSSRKMFN
jgi:hypothetical protein